MSEIEIQNKMRLRYKEGKSKNRQRLDSKEETALNDKYLEGHCGICDRYGVYVWPTLVSICYECQQKHLNPDAVLAIFNPELTGFCVYCGLYAKPRFISNIATLNVYMCNKCNDKRAKILKNVRTQGGIEKIHPMWRYIRKQYGMDHLDYLAGNVNVLKAALKRWPSVTRIAPDRLRRMLERQEKEDKKRRR